MTKAKKKAAAKIPDKGTTLVRVIHHTAVSNGVRKMAPGECCNLDKGLAKLLLEAGLVEILDDPALPGLQNAD